MTIVLKLGGSVVTEKDVPETVDEDRLASLAAAVAGVDESLVIVHGGGSFGHHHAAKYDVSVSEGTADPVAAREIHDAMIRLNQAVVGSLAAQNVPALPVQPLSMCARDGNGTLTLEHSAIERQLSEGFVPVLHGDVIAHEGEGVSVLSGDELVVGLANQLAAERVGVCSSVPGVLDETGTVIDRIDDGDGLEHVLGESDATDVSGGMAGKVAALLELDVPASIFAPTAIEAFLGGETPGTTVGGGQTGP